MQGAKTTGQPVRDYARQWRAALKAANLPPGRLPYDLRRSALRNMIRGGTDIAVAMRISGHRTRSTFDRYNIVSTDDLRAAVNRTAAYVASLPTERNVVAMNPNLSNEHGQNTRTIRFRRVPLDSPASLWVKDLAWEVWRKRVGIECKKGLLLESSQ